MTKRYLAKILAKDRQGLQVISACCAGAKAKITDIKYLNRLKSVHFINYHNFNRPYINFEKSNLERWIWNMDFSPIPGELYFSEDEKIVQDIKETLDPYGIFVVQLMPARPMLDTYDIGNVCNEHLLYSLLYSLYYLMYYHILYYFMYYSIVLCSQ